METKNNIAAILKDKTQGTKLYDWLHNIDVELDTISTTDTETVVWCTNETNNNTTCHRGYSEFGTERGYPDGLQILFPSKEMRDWAKFSWKKGDALIMDGCRVVFDKWLDDTYARFNAVHLITSSGGYFDKPWQNRYTPISNFITKYWRKMTDLETKIYMESLERECGGKLNLTTLNIEKQPKFKDGDIVTIMPRIGDKLIYLFKAEDDEKYYGHAFLDGNIAIVNDDSYCQKDFCTARPSTEKEKQQFLEALAKKHIYWDCEHKKILDMSIKVELKPFDKVLVRDSESDNWRANLFGYIGKDGYYHCVFANWVYCIPYAGNEHLLGTTKDVGG